MNYGHWHVPYKPPWWRVIKRWKLRRRRTVVHGTLKTFGGYHVDHAIVDEIHQFQPKRVGRFVQFEDLPPAEQQRIERWFGK